MNTFNSRIISFIYVFRKQNSKQNKQNKTSKKKKKKNLRKITIIPAIIELSSTTRFAQRFAPYSPSCERKRILGNQYLRSSAQTKEVGDSCADGEANLGHVISDAVTEIKTLASGGFWRDASANIYKVKKKKQKKPLLLGKHFIFF